MADTAPPAAADETNVISWVIDGERYDVDLWDLDGVEWRDAKRATGLLQWQVVNQALVGEFDAIAAVVWLWRRREDPTLTYEDVLRGLKPMTVRKVTEEDGPANPPD